MKHTFLITFAWIGLIALYITNIVIVCIKGANLANNINGWVCCIILACFWGIPVIIQVYKTEKREKEIEKKLKDYLDELENWGREDNEK